MESESEEILLTVDYEGGDRGLPTSDGSLVGLTAQILALLAKHDAKATFFVVAAVAEQHPDLIEGIVAAGHEIGLHTCRHTPLAQLGRKGFEEDTRRGLEVLTPFTEHGRVYGFRAPFFSLSNKTDWAFDILNDLGFIYDSSVLPVWNPICGYIAEESEYVNRMANGLWSVPVSVFSLTRRIGVPVGGGVYLRLLPEWMNQMAARRYHEAGHPLNVYFHPYDIQPDAPTGNVFGNNLFLNTLLKMRRKAMVPRLERMMSARRAWRVIDYIRAQDETISLNGR